MQHVCVRCQSLQAATHNPDTPDPTQPETVPLVKNASDQHVSTTCSRRLRHAKDFIDAVRWTVKHHPRANDTTLTVAYDFAARMPDSKDGHVAYTLATMHRRLGIARSTVADHVAILRELGLLCWVEHGSQRNALRTRLGNRFTAGVGYRPTATIYAPCAPPEYDRAHGQLRDGTGYHSRIRAYTPHGRLQAIANARARQARRTPSFHTRTPYSPARRGEGSKDSAARPPRATTPLSQARRKSTGVTPQEAAAGIDHAQSVRLEIWWTQSTCTRQLGFALRPLIHGGYTWQETARELARWHVRTRPNNAAAFIRAELRRRAHTGQLHLPEGSVKPYRQAPADETGDRHRAMIQSKWAQYGPAFAHYHQTLAAPLRAALRQFSSPRAPQSSLPRPRLRESEDLFHRARSTPQEPRDIYRSRAWGLRDEPAPPPAVSGEEDHQLWAELAEHAQAAAVFQRLREELANAAVSDMPAQQTGRPGQAGSLR